MIDDKNPRRINPKGIGLIYIYITYRWIRDGSRQGSTGLHRRYLGVYLETNNEGVSSKLCA